MSFVTSLITTIALAAGLAACATDTSPTQGQASGALGQNAAAGTANGTNNAPACQYLLDQLDEVCYPTEKSYTPDESAACVSQQTQSYERCQRAADCQVQLDAAIEACGSKGSDTFEACVDQAQQAFSACSSAGGGTAP